MKLRRKTFTTFKVAAVFLYLISNIQFIFPHPFIQSSNFEKGMLGDCVSYRDGALSIREFYAIKKFNDKKQPIMGANKTEEKDFAKWASWLAICFPNPSFKFGYSLISAIVTMPIPYIFFEKIAPLLVFANLVLGLILVIVMYEIIFKLTKSADKSFFGSTLFMFDPFFISTNYQYQSHTLSGLLFSCLAFRIFLASNTYKWKPFLIGICAVFSLLCSSHLVVFTITLALGILILELYNQQSLQCKLKYFFSFAMGVVAWPAYILCTEKLLNFKKLGLPLLKDQILSYSGYMKPFFSQTSLFERQIWDLSLANPFISYIIGVSFLFFISKSLKFAMPRSIGKRIPEFVFIIPAIAFLVYNFCFSLPVTRAIMPSLFFVYLTIGVLVGDMLAKRSFWKICGLSILLSICLNFALYNYTVQKRLTFITEKRLFQSPNLISVTDHGAFALNSEKYLKDPQNYIYPCGKYGDFSKDLKSFLAEKKPEQIQSGILEIKPFDIISAYSDSRRWWKIHVHNQQNLVDQQKIESDFKLLKELFALKTENPKLFSEEKVLCWNPQIFDQEFIYIYGYRERIKTMLNDSVFKNVNFKKIYYIKLNDLNDIFLSKRP